MTDAELYIVTINRYLALAQSKLTEALLHSAAGAPVMDVLADLVEARAFIADANIAMQHSDLSKRDAIKMRGAKPEG